MQESHDEASNRQAMRDHQRALSLFSLGLPH